ncbi:MAG TPA: site-specific DNA-methyltransferase [Methanocorpusculum sp.]|nr:site-specific DNA-methyltransferase [Methanocorpusculum sp.]HJK80808.1 site-specific DNA-methyltransferase [Methanocorpusculum sp.]
MTDTKLTGYTPDIAEENIAALRQLFPEICCEDRIDFEKLRQLLGEYVEDEKERYNFTWNGKGRALRLSQQPTRGTLRPCPEESKDWDTTQNLYIEGDNLEVLKLLQKSYHGKVKMIYIDPPYNTGNDFVYPDDYTDNLKNYLEMTGQVDEEGKAYSVNTESNGRYHTDWLNMLYPRLRLARNLLSDDGVIFISIDDNEASNLRKICDEIFGESNFRNAIFTRRYDKNLNRQFIDNGLSTMNTGLEYVLMYSKYQSTKYNPVFRKNSEERASTGYWKGFWNDADRPTMRYEILGVTPKSGQWKWKKELAEEAIMNYIEYCESYQQVMTLEEYWESTGRSKKFIRHNPAGKGRNQGIEHWVAPATGILRNTNWSDLLASKTTGVDMPFDSPKNTEVLVELVRISNANDNGVILDFFSGSSTTAHAVMQLNAEDGGSRRFIMVQLPEPCKPDSEAAKAGYKTICEIGMERIRRAGEKIKAELREKSTGQTTLDGSGTSPNPDDLDIGFRVFKLDTSNILAWQPNTDNLNQTLQDYVDNLDPSRSELDLVYELMIKEGLPLTEQIEEITIAGKHIYSIGYGLLQICLDDHITIDLIREMVNHKPEENLDAWRVIFKDNGFASDSHKLNAREILKAAGLAEDAFRTI